MIAALIPARGGSKRIPGKHLRMLGGHPVLYYTIQAAITSEIFSDVSVCTDDARIAEWCLDHAACRVIQRSPASATDDAPDIRWVTECLPSQAAFAILRPTSPFRTAETIRRAWRQFQDQQPCDSLRAVEPVRQHPGKMWTVGKDGTLLALLPYKHADGTPWHSSPVQTLRPFLVQNASLEIAWTRVVRDTGTISGTTIRPFYTVGLEGFDLNTMDDWREAERLMPMALEYLG